jgi:hypothetical protein
VDRRTDKGEGRENGGGSEEGIECLNLNFLHIPIILSPGKRNQFY